MQIFLFLQTLRKASPILEKKLHLPQFLKCKLSTFLACGFTWH